MNETVPFTTGDEVSIDATEESWIGREPELPFMCEISLIFCGKFAGNLCYTICFIHSPAALNRSFQIMPGRYQSTDNLFCPFCLLPLVNGSSELESSELRLWTPCSRRLRCDSSPWSWVAQTEHCHKASYVLHGTTETRSLSKRTSTKPLLSLFLPFLPKSHFPFTDRLNFQARLGRSSELPSNVGRGKNSNVKLCFATGKNSFLPTKV